MTDLAGRLAALSPAQRALLDLRARKRRLDLLRAGGSSRPGEVGDRGEPGDPAGAAAPRSQPDQPAEVAASREQAEPLGPAPIPRRPWAASYPLSIDQERIFFIHELNPGSPFYNLYTVMRWRGRLAGPPLRAATDEIVRRHEIFRTRFVLVEGQPAQVVETPFPPGGAVSEIDFTALPEGAGAVQAAADREVSRLLKAPFALGRLPLFRLALLRLRSDDFILVYAFHHIILDWVSFHAFQRELVLLYRAFAEGLPSPLAELPVQYADYAVWQRARLTSEALAAEWDYWRNQLRDAPHITELPMDRPRPPVQSGLGLRRFTVLPGPVSDAVRGVARRQGVTLFMLFLALFKALVLRLSGQERVVVGSPMAVREHPDLAEMLGFFLNQLVLFTDLSGDPDLHETLRRVRATVLGAFAHKDTPFGQVVALVRPARDLSRMPLTQLTLLFLNPQLFELPQLPDVEPLPYDFDGESSKFDLTLALWDRGHGFDGLLEYNPTLFDATTVARIDGCFQALAAQAVSEPGVALSQLSLLSAAERHQAVLEWNDVPAPAGAGLPAPGAREGSAILAAPEGGAPLLHELVWRQGRRAPEAVAISHEGRLVSHAELGDRARRLARVLRAAGVGPDVVVGLLLRRSPEMIVGLLGILEAGGAFLPLDPAYPAERLGFLLADSGARLLVSDSALVAERGESLAGLGVQTVPLDALDEEDEGDEGAAGAGVAERLAYLLYTSGSTGRPKGVMVPHGAVVNLLLAMRERPGLRQSDRALAVTTLSFDISLLEIFLPLMTGAQLVIAGEETVRDGEALARLVAGSDITWMQATPATWRLLLASGFAGRPGLRLLCGGEALPAELAARLSRCGDELWNLYGPTETTIWSLAGRVTSSAGGAPAAAGAVPPGLGQPVAGNLVYLLDPGMNPVPRGTVGEVYIAGAGLARGYLHRPELTAERFLPDPLTSSGGPGGRLYRVGDLARRRGDSTLEFLGRIDHQIKLRGFRIELGEIEAALLECAEVAEAAVVLLAAAAPREPALVAFVVRRTPATAPAAGMLPGTPPAGGAGQGSGREGSAPAGLASAPDQAWAAALRAELRRRLPEFMLPARCLALARLPRTPNGKLDRAGLLRCLPPEEPVEEAGRARPTTPVEEVLSLIWGEVLGTGSAGPEDDFFAAGGHSLLAMRVISRVRELLHADLPVRAVFEAPTLAGLARRIEAARAAAEPSAVPPLGRLTPAGPAREGVPLALSFAQERLWFLDRLVPGSTFYSMPYALRLGGRLEPAALGEALGEIVRRHEALRTTFEVGGEGLPVQRVHPWRGWSLPLVDLAADPARAEAEARRLAEAEAATPFDLSGGGGGSLFRARLVRLAAEEHLLMLNLHHIVCDGWSIGVLHGELEALYAARLGARGSGVPSAGPAARELPEPPVQYADYAAWQRGWLRGEALDRQLGYWRERLAGCPPVLRLPADRPRADIQRFRGGICAFDLSDRSGQEGAPGHALRELGRAQGATLAMTLLSGFYALLSRVTGAERIPVGTPVAGRTAAGLEGLIGFFVNSLALVADLGGRPSFETLTGRVRELALDAYSHQDIPFEKLVEELDLERDLSRNPLFQVVFVLQNAPMTLPRLAGLHCAPVGFEMRTTRFDLEVHVWEDLSGFISYDRDLFDATTVARLAGQLRALLGAAAADPRQAVAELAWLSAAERHQLLAEWGRGGERRPLRLLHEELAARVRSAPGALAVSDGVRRLSYAELARQAEELAGRLVRLGRRERGGRGGSRTGRHERAAGGGGAIVGVLTGRSLELPAACLGVLLSGAAYLPLDPDSPPSRLEWMLEAAGCSVLVAGPGRRELAETLAAARGLELLIVPPPVTRPAALPPSENGSPALSGLAAPGAPPAVDPEQPAYVLFTSGSTGQPKGIVVSHRSLANLTAWYLDACRLGPTDRTTLVAAVSFDVSVLELWPTLAVGGSLHVAEEKIYGSADRLMAWLAGEQITVGFLPTPMAQEALAAPAPAGLRLRALVTGGSALHAVGGDLAFPVLNIYGPAEGTVVTTWAAVPGGGAKPPIGRPVAGARVAVVDRELQPLPAGVPGELVLGGEGLSQGYLGRPDLTAERFLPDPRAEVPGSRIYRSGDLVRWLPDGNLDFLGRLDHQVKLRGVRIEPGEIEAVLRQLPLVREAVVLLARQRPGAPLAGATADAAGDGDGDDAAQRAASDQSAPGATRPGPPAAHPHLVAYLVLADGSPDPGAAAGPAGETRAAGAGAAGPLAPDPLSQVAGWRAVFEDHLYQDLSAGEGDPALNIAGWRSSYTGESLGAEAMRDWLDGRVASIRRHSPRRVLEIGCGTGMLLFALAPHCETYWGTDFSPASLGYVRRQLAAGAGGAAEIRLLERRADDWSGIPARAFDAVVLNSVVQYFPDLDYLLAVLERAVEALAPGGVLFLGDLRSLPLLAAFHASVEEHRAAPQLRRRELAARVRRAVARDEELAVDPAFFGALRRRLPRLAGARLELHLPSGRFANELSSFRYDVTFHLGGGEGGERVSEKEEGGGPAPPLSWLEWRRDGLDLEELRRRLAAAGSPVTGVLGVPNARVVAAARVLAWLGAEGRPETVGGFRRLAGETAGIDPDQLRALGEELGYEVGLAWAAPPPPPAQTPPTTATGPRSRGVYLDALHSPARLGDFDVVFARRGALAGISAGSPPGSLLPLCDPATPATPAMVPEQQASWSGFANHPLAARLGERLAPKLRAFLRERLPEAMVPRSYVVLGELPLTRHGKIDREALAMPEEAAPATGPGGAAAGPDLPRTPVEEALAGIWCEVLDRPRVGVTEDFFAAGGHSLAAIRVLSRARDVLGVDLPVRTLFEAPTISALARRLEAALAERSEAAEGAEARPAVGRGETQLPIAALPRERDGVTRLPVSFAQQRLWFLDRLAPGSAAYNIPAALRLTGRLDRALLRDALCEIERRHEAWRTTFAQVGGAPVQLIVATLPAIRGFGVLPVVDLGVLPVEAREAEARRLAAEEAARPFDLAAGPLWRARLLALAPAEHVLLVNQHHIISDGWSIGVLFDELEALYGAARAGRRQPLAPLSIQYADFAVWQRERLQGDRLAEQLAYWKQRLGGGLPELHLPLDRPRPEVQRSRGGMRRLALPPAVVARLRAVRALRAPGSEAEVESPAPAGETGSANRAAMAGSQGGTGGTRGAGQAAEVTLAMTLTAAFFALLARMTGQERIVMGSPVAGRLESGLERLIGLFANTLVMVGDLAGDPPFRELLGRTRATVLEALGHQEVPFERLVEELAPERSLAQNPLFQVVFGFQNAPAAARLWPAAGLQLSAFEHEAQATRFDLELHLWDAPEGLHGFCSYRTDLFDGTTIARLLDHFQNLLASAGENPRTRLSELAWLGDAERHQLVVEWRSPAGGGSPEGAYRTDDGASGANEGTRDGGWVAGPAGEPLPIGLWGEVWSGDRHGGAAGGERGRWRHDGRLEMDPATRRRLRRGGQGFALWQTEEALLSSPLVADCAVLLRAGEGGERLVAYVVSALPETPAAARGERLAEELSAHCAGRLPETLHPAAYVPVAALPLTPQGVLDREALAALEVPDGELLARWEATLDALPEVETAVALVRDWTPALPPLHRLDLPAWSRRSASPAGAGAALDPALPGAAGVARVGDPDAAPAAGEPPRRRPPTAAEAPDLVPALADGGALEVPEGAPRTLIEALLRTAAEHPERGILHIRADRSQVFQSYPELLADARRVLTGLRSAGLGPGSRVILQIPDLAQHFTALWGAVLGGISPVTVAVAPSYSERGAVVNKLFNTWKLLGHPPILTSRGLREALAGLSRLFPEDAGLAVLAIEELAAHPPAAELHEAAPEEVVFLQLTSGSTGVPKCIQETHRGILAHVHGSRQFLGLSPEDVILNWLPMDHVVPTLTYHLKDVVLGCQEIQVPTAAVLASPLLWLDLMAEHRVTHTWSPNFGFKLVSERLAQEQVQPAQEEGRRWDLSSLRLAMNAGEQVTMAVVREFLARVAPFGVAEETMQPAYGMAEVCTAMTYRGGFSCATGSRRFRKSSLSGLLEEVREPAVGREATVEFVDVGPPIPGVSVRIVDRDNQLLPEGVIGRLQIRGEVVTPGYLRNEEANREAFVGEGWFNTGDLAFLLDGRLAITGREKEIIIVRGANFYCYEIEDVVSGVPGVEPTFCGACGIADAATGTEGLAVFFAVAVGTPETPETPENTEAGRDGRGGEPSGQEPLAVTRETLETVARVRTAVTASFGISPSHVVPMTAAEFPKTTSGKIQRTQLERWLREGRFSDLLKRLDLLAENDATLPDWFFRKVWRSRLTPAERTAPPGETTLVFVDPSGLGDRIGEELERQGRRWARVEAGGAFARLGDLSFRIDPGAPADYRRLLSELGPAGEAGRGPLQVIHCWTYGEPAGGGRDRGSRATAEPLGMLFLLQSLAGLQPGGSGLPAVSSGVPASTSEGPGAAAPAGNPAVAGALAVPGAPGKGLPVRLLAVSSHAQPVVPGDHLACNRATLPPLLATAAQELPWLDCRHLDLEGEGPAPAFAEREVRRAHGRSDSSVLPGPDGESGIEGGAALTGPGAVAGATGRLTSEAGRVLEELAVVSGEREVAWRGGRRLVARLARVDPRRALAEAVPFRRGGRYLVSGGMGGLGIELARFLLDRYDCRLLLAGRRALGGPGGAEERHPERPGEPREFQRYRMGGSARTEEPGPAQAERHRQAPIAGGFSEGSGGSEGSEGREGPSGRERLERPERPDRPDWPLGGGLAGRSGWSYVALDICDAGAVAAAVAEAEAAWGATLDGVIHLAGAYHERTLLAETEESFNAVLRPKVEGALALDRLLEERPEASFISFSSVNSFFGGYRVGAYAAANGFLEGLAHAQRRAGRRQASCLAWSLWDERGMSRGRAMQQAAAASGFRAIQLVQGLDSLELALGLDQPAIFIGLAADKPNVRRMLVEESCRAQRPIAFLSLREGASGTALEAAERVEVKDRFGTVLHGELRQVAEMPRGEDGIDRRRLLALDEATAAGPVAPRTELERRVLGIWQEVLGSSRLGVRDNFFRSGGHSLLAVRLLSRVETELGREVPLATLFAAPTVAQMAELLAGGAEAATTFPALVPIQPAGTRPPFFCVSPILGTVFPYYELARHLGTDQPFYGLQPASFATASSAPSATGRAGSTAPERAGSTTPGRAESTAPGRAGTSAIGRAASPAAGAAPASIEELASSFLDAIRAVQPTGPYSLGGWSFGTLVAYEMARQLVAQGEEVGLVALLDAPAPLPSQRPSLGRALRSFGELLLRDFLPYVRDYLYLVNVAGGGDGVTGAKGEDHATRRTRRAGPSAQGRAESSAAGTPPSASGNGGNGAGRASRFGRLLRGLSSLGALRDLVQGAAIARAVPAESRLVALHPPQVRAMLKALRENSNAMSRYTPRPYPGRLTLFRTASGHTPNGGPALGWDTLAPAGVTVHQVPGNHMTLLRPPHVSSLAASLAEALASAGRPSSSPSSPPS